MNLSEAVNEIAQPNPSPLSHNGWFTIHNPKTGGHRTFEIRTVTNEDSGLYGKRIVALLIGPNRDDYECWASFGFVTEKGIKIWASKKDGVFAKYARLLEHRDAGEKAGLEYMAETRCRVCNRKLTNPTSIVSGIGPICDGGGY